MVKLLTNMAAVAAIICAITVVPVDAQQLNPKQIEKNREAELTREANQPVAAREFQRANPSNLGWLGLLGLLGLGGLMFRQAYRDRNVCDNTYGDRSTIGGHGGQRTAAQV